MMLASGLDLGSRHAAFVSVKRRGAALHLENAALLDFAGDDSEDARARALSRAIRRKSSVRLGVAGREAILRYLKLPHVPAWRLRLLMEVEASDVAEKAGEALAADYRLLQIPADLGAEEEGLSVLVGLAKESALLPRIDVLARQGVAVERALPTSIALFNAFVGLGHIEAAKTTIVLDAGHEGVELAIVREGLLLFARSLPPLSLAEAGMDARAAQQLASAVAASVQYCRAQQKLKALPIDEVAVSGAYARSAELLEALRHALKVDVRAFDPFERMDLGFLPVETRRMVGSRGPEYALAVGLALATAHPRCVDLDLTPKSLVARRDFLNRTMFLYASGALLAVALIVSTATVLVSRSRARERNRELTKMRVGLEGRRDDLEALGQKNARSIAVLDELARRTHGGVAALRLLGRLRELTPSRVTIGDLSLVAASPPTGSERPDGKSRDTSHAPDVHFQLSGEADNAAGDAVEALQSFERALAGDPAVASAKVKRTEQSGEALQFTMVVDMPAEPRGAED